MRRSHLHSRLRGLERTGDGSWHSLKDEPRAQNRFGEMKVRGFFPARIVADIRLKLVLYMVLGRPFLIPGFDCDSDFGCFFGFP